MCEALVSRRRVSLAFRLSIVLAALLVPGHAFAQDTRMDEAPEQAPGGASQVPRVDAGLFKQPQLVSSAIDYAFDRYGDTGTPKDGFYLELSNMITGSGFVSIGPGYRHQILNNRGFVDMSAAVSWRLYNMMQGRVEISDLFNNRLSVGGQVMWQDQTQINYFGIGPNSLETNQSQYQLQSIDTVTYATLRPLSSLAFTGEFGFLRRPDALSPGGTFKPSVPTTVEEFPNEPGVSDPFQPNYLHGELSLTRDTRNHRSWPTSGGLYRAQMTSFVDKSTSIGRFTFQQYEAEGLQIIPVMEDYDWRLALHGWIVWSDVPRGNQVPFYLLPSLGGNNSLRSFADYRFHDQNLAVANVESRWGVWTNLDLAVFLDAGNVGPRVQDLNLDKTSIGAGLRLHTERATFARFDVAYGADGWNFVFRTSDPLRLARLTRRVAAVPFVD
jgi:hypothetical protein